MNDDTTTSPASSVRMQAAVQAFMQKVPKALLEAGVNLQSEDTQKTVQVMMNVFVQDLLPTVLENFKDEIIAANSRRQAPPAENE